MQFYEELKDLGIFPIYVLVICSLLTGLYQYLMQLRSRQFKATKEELVALMDVFRDPQLMNSPFIIEQVIQLKLKRLVPYQAIVMLLKFESPTGSMIDFWNASAIVQVPPGKKYLAYTKLGGSAKKRAVRKWAGGIAYWLTALFATGLLSVEIGQAGKGFPVEVLALLALSVPLVIACMFIAYAALSIHLSVVCAERLMEEAALHGLVGAEQSADEAPSAAVPAAEGQPVA